MQRDAMHCGIACLKMICNYFGMKISYEYLEDFCGTSPQGITLNSINKTAMSLGFKTRCKKLTINELNNEKQICILHWNQNHFIVLYKVTKRHYYIADPSKGPLKLNINSFLKHWIPYYSEKGKYGIALFVEPTPDFYNKRKELSKIVHSNKNKYSLHVILTYLRRDYINFISIFLGLILSGVILLLLPFLTQNIVDVGIKQKNIDFIWLILLGQLMLTFSRTIIDFIRSWLLLHISLRINISIVSDFFIKLLRLPMSFFDSKHLGDLLQRVSDHSRVNNFFTSQAVNIIYSIMCFITFSIILIYYSKLIFSIFFFGSIIYGLWMFAFLHKRKLLDYELFEQQSINNNKTYQFLTNIQEIKLQDCENRRRWEWEDVQADLFTIQIKSLKLKQAQEAGCIFINEVKNIILTIIAAVQVIEGNFTLGMMLAIQYVVGQLNTPIDQIMSFIYSLQDVKISMDRINEVHKRNDEENGRTNNVKFRNENNSIIINNVSFKYNKFSKYNILDNINLTIKEGKITAIVGESGSGKTTLIKLLLGYYMPDNGIISIQNYNLNEINLKFWRKQCGTVMQEGIIFSDTIARNIAVGDDEINFNLLNYAISIANVDDIIKKLPIGINTIIGPDGIKLSQGQKQRILIARAVYKNPKFIFFDEATNSLDANNEKNIVDNLSTFFKGKTVVIVAHRLSTVKNADQIIVLSQGRIVERGEHHTLLEKKGMYYNLIKNQLEIGE